MREALDVIETEDGSITCLDKETGELYHNRAGAFTEALKNYVEPCRLASLIKTQANICLLDVCFGLGYNTFVFLDQLTALLESQPSLSAGLDIRILAIDKDPEILRVIPRVLAEPKLARLVDHLALAAERPNSWVKEIFSRFGHQNLNLTKAIRLNLEIRQADIRQCLPQLVRHESAHFDFIFHDGFSPRRMPELWTIDLFNQYIRLLKPSGKIITYSSASAVRGALRACGLEVKKTSAVGGKSGGTIAAHPGQIKLDENIFELSEQEDSRLNKRSGVPYRDPKLIDSRQIIINRRQIEISGE